MDFLAHSMVQKAKEDYGDKKAPEVEGTNGVDEGNSFSWLAMGLGVLLGLFLANRNLKSSQNGSSSSSADSQSSQSSKTYATISDL